VLAAAPLALCLVTRLPRRVFSDPIVVAHLALLALAAAWIPFATNNFWAFETWKNLALYLLVLLAFSSFVVTPARVRGTLVVLLGLFSAHAVWGLTHGGRGMNALLADENDFALAMSVALPFALLGIFAVRGWPTRILLVLASALFVAGVVTSRSRGGLVALAACSLAMVLMSRRRLLMGTLIAIGIALLAGLISREYWAEMQTMFDPADATREERIRHWEEAWRVWLDNPLVGVGPGNVPWVVGRYEVYDEAVSNSLAGRSVHSLYFTLLADLGLAGVILYGALAVRSWRRFRGVLRAPQPVRGLRPDLWMRAVVCSLVACLAGGLFLSTLYYPYLYYLIALGVTLAALRPQGLEEPARLPTPWARPLHAAGRAALAGLALVIGVADGARAQTPARGFTLHLDFDEGRPGDPPHGRDAFDELASGSRYTRERSYEGGQAAELRIAQRTDGWDSFGGRRFLPSEPGKGDELWIRVRAFFPEGFDFSADPMLKFLRVHTRSGGEHGYDDWLFNHPDRGHHPGHYFVSGAQDAGRECGRPDVHDPVRGRWETYEMHLGLDDVAARHGGGGRVRLWKDGELICEIDDLATLRTPESRADAFLLSTYWNGGAPRTQVMYVDDIVITSRTPTGRDAHGNPMIGPGGALP
jgi:O-antigen ligase